MICIPGQENVDKFLDFHIFNYNVFNNVGKVLDHILAAGYLRKQLLHCLQSIVDASHRGVRPLVEQLVYLGWEKHFIENFASPDPIRRREPL